MRSLFFAVGLALAYILVVDGLNQCELTPKWRLDRYTFPGNAKTKVKFVALLKASCGFCQTQARVLGELKEALEKEDYPSVTYLIINSYEPTSFNRTDVFKTPIPVLQDNSKVRVWDLYNGTTDDMLVFDKCNRLVRHLTLPDSIVDPKGGIVKDAIIEAYNKDTCGSSCKLPRRTRINKPKTPSS